MGLICSKVISQGGTEDNVLGMQGRLFGGGSTNGKNRFQLQGCLNPEDPYYKQCITAEPGSLLERCIEVMCDTMLEQNKEDLKLLPLELMQLLMHSLILNGKLNGQTVMKLEGTEYFDLFLDGYPFPGLSAAWAKYIFPRTLESVVLSRTRIDDYFVTHIPPLPALKRLYLDRCENITDNSLIVLAHTPMLEDLSLDYCLKITSLGLACVGELKGLKKLSLKSCLKVRGLHHLVGLKNLRDLDLGYCHSVDNCDAKYLGQMVQLERLTIQNTKISNTGLVALKGLQRLRVFSAAGLDVSDVSMSIVIACMPCLEELDLSRCSGVSQCTMKSLVRDNDFTPPPLQKLNVTYTGVDDRGLEGILPLLKNMTSFYCESCRLSNRSLEGLQHLHKLVELNVADTRACNRTMEAISNLPCLEKLDLSFTYVEDLGLQYVAKITSLKCLNLDSKSISDSGLIHVARLPTLEDLDLFGAKITDSGCAVLANIKTLKRLEICSGELSSSGVSQIGRLSNLEHLSLAYNQRISDGALPWIIGLRNLKVLNLSQSEISSQGIVSLGCLKQLRVLSLVDTPIKKFAVEKLLQMNRALEIKGFK